MCIYIYMCVIAYKQVEISTDIIYVFIYTVKYIQTNLEHLYTHEISRACSHEILAFHGLSLNPGVWKLRICIISLQNPNFEVVFHCFLKNKGSCFKSSGNTRT